LTGEVHIRDARFVAGAARADQLPSATAPEVAFAGRSNVGKSSVIQTLAQRRGLVRISNTPGRTRQINVFALDVVDFGALSFADLPGYGYAKVSKAERKSWGPLLERYLERREDLRAVVVIVDARRGAEPGDEQLVEYLISIDRQPIIVATKIDKLPKHQQKPRALAIGKALGARAVAYSAVTGVGRTELWGLLLRLCAPAPARSEPDPAPPPTSSGDAGSTARDRGARRP
jgi:GTP-binding protein